MANESEQAAALRREIMRQMADKELNPPKPPTDLSRLIEVDGHLDIEALVRAVSRSG